MANEINNPFSYLSDRRGDSLDQGFMYIGEANKDPELFPVDLYWDEGLTIPAAQPLRTIAGYIINPAAGNSPGEAYAESTSYSIRIRDRLGSQIFYTAESSGAVKSGDLSSLDPEKGASLVSGVIQVVRVTDYGFTVTDPTGAGNLAAIKTAVAAAAEGATVYIPGTLPLTGKIDTSGGASDAVLIDKRINLMIDGAIEATDTIVGTNASVIFSFMPGSEGSSLTGTGTISGDGTIRDASVNEPELDRPCLVRVFTDNFTCKEVTFAKIPQIGLHFAFECFGALVEGAKFTGGPTAYDDTAHFGIRCEDGGRHTFAFNRFFPDAGGGMMVQCILNAGADDCTFIGNHGLHPYEKLVYSFGDRNLIMGNVTVGNSGFIPGTNRQGTITSVYRCHGDYNQVIANRTYKCSGGAQMMDGIGHIVEHNVDLSCGQSAITSFAGPGETNNLTGATFRFNRFTKLPLLGSVSGDGMRLVSNTAASKLAVEGNDSDGFSVADPLVAVEVWDATTAYGKHSIVKPTVGNGRYYQVTIAGTSGATEPTWPTTPGDTIVDGSVTWVAVAYEGGQREIKVLGLDGANTIQQSSINNNKTSGGQYGIQTQFVTDSQIKNNQISATEWGLTETDGERNNWRSNSVVGTVNTGVQLISESSKRASGLPFAWTPNQGSGLTVTGIFSSTGLCVEDESGLVHVSGTLSATTSLFNDPAAGGLLCSNLPIPAVAAGAGSLTNTDAVSPSGCFVIPAPDAAGKPAGATPTRLYGGSTGSRTTLIFSLTYAA